MGETTKKRGGDESPRPATGRATKKRRRQRREYHSDSDSVESSGSDNSEHSFRGVDLLGSDREAPSKEGDEAADSLDSLDSLSSPGGGGTKQNERRRTSEGKAKQESAANVAMDGDVASGDSNDDEDDDGEDGVLLNDNASDSDDNSDDSSYNGAQRRLKYKRNDPNTFSTSMHKILGTKLSSTRRADPVLARSADAREASRHVVDAALEEKARRQLRLEKRAALEKGHVKDVLVASNVPTRLAGASETHRNDDTQESTATILATERRLRKVAQRGVVQLFNAVRAAQVKAAHAKKLVKQQGILGMDKREAKVTQLSRKGFLDLIASGGGSMKKGGLEEA